MALNERKGLLVRLRVLLDPKARAKAEKDLEETGKKGGKNMAAALMKSLAVGFFAAFSVKLVKDFAQVMFRIGTNVEETESKFRVTFGRMANHVAGFIDEWKTLAGTTATVGKDVLSTLGAIVQGMGATEEQAADMSIKMATMAADLQAFYNVDIQEVLKAIQSGLIGSSEPMRRFGAVVLETDVQLRALTMTGKQHVDQLTQLDRAQARLQLMLEGTGTAAGYAESELSSTASMARRATARFQEMRENLAVRLLPAFDSLLQVLDDNSDGVDALGESMSTLIRGAASALLWTLATLTQAFSGMIVMYNKFELARLKFHRIGATPMFREEMDRNLAEIEAKVAQREEMARRMFEAAQVMRQGASAVWSAAGDENAGFGHQGPRVPRARLLAIARGEVPGSGGPPKLPGPLSAEERRAQEEAARRRRFLMQEQIRFEQMNDPFRLRTNATGRELDDIIRGTPWSAESLRSLLPDPLDISRALASVDTSDIVDSIRQIIPDYELRTEFANSLAESIVGGIEDGFRAVFESGSIGKGFAMLGAGLVGGLGGAMVEFGKASLVTSTLMEKIKNSLAGFLPGGAISASLAMIAIGSAMQAMSSNAQRSFGGNYSERGGFVSSSSGAGSSVNADARNLNTVTNIYFDPFNEHNPVAVETVGRMVNGAADKGIINVHPMHEAAASGRRAAA